VTFLAASHSASKGAEDSTRGATINVDILKGESKNDRAARAASSLREREEQVRIDRARISKSTQHAKGTLGREESEREFTSLLIDVVRDHKATWGVVLFLLEKDPRFNVPNVSLGDKRQLFEAHIRILQEKRKSSVEALFFASAQSFNTPFEKVFPKISTDPKVTRLVGDDFDLLETLFVSWAQRREKIARREFDELLRESAVVEHWGRLQKKDEDDSGKKVLEEEDDDAVDEEGITGGTDLKEMAKQIDTKAIHAVLKVRAAFLSGLFCTSRVLTICYRKHDKRYLVFDHLGEERSQWIEDYISQLTAPKLTVYQKD
jgi:transcription elongation regulator 1